MSREGETRLQRHCAAAFGYLGLFIIATATSACVSSRAPQFAPLPKPDDGSAVVYVYKRPTVLVARAASRALFANDKPIAVFDGTGKYFPHVTKERELSYAAANTTKGRILTGLIVSSILAASDP